MRLRSRFALLPVLLLVPSFPRPAGANRPAPRQPAALPSFGDETTRLVFFAVLEGLYEDGVGNDVVDAIVAPSDSDKRPPLFVPGCPLCLPALNAFVVYRARTPFVGLKTALDTFGDGLPDAVVRELTSPDYTIRHAALGTLVEGWVQRRLEAMRLTPEERADWSLRFAEGRKVGMSALAPALASGGYGPVKSCAVCDAANDACGTR